MDFQYQETLPPPPPSQQESRPRPRRTYSCGPCKRYKMKCNMELPCRLCVLAKRERDCMLNPPNPPSEEEKTKIARRRLRNLRRRELEQLQASRNHNPLQAQRKAATKVVGVKLYSTSPNAGAMSLSPDSNHIIHGGSRESSPSLLNSLSSDQMLQLFIPDSTDPVPSKTHTGVNIHDFMFSQKYAAQCKSTPIVVPRSAVERWKPLMATFNPHHLPAIFQKCYFCEHGGLHEILDLNVIMTVAHNALVTMQRISEYSSWTIDKFLLQRLSLACIMMAEADATDGAAVRAVQCLEISREMKEMVGPIILSGDCIYLTQWIILGATPYMVLNLSDDFRLIFDAYLATVLTLNEFVHQLHLHECNGPDSEEFLACARLWVLVKILETEMAVLQPKSSLQFKWLPLQQTVMPTRDIVKRIYGLDFLLQRHDLSPFNFILLSSNEFFCRFENATQPQHIVYLYLTLYADVARQVLPYTDSFCAALAAPIDMSFLSQHGVIMAILGYWHFLLIRWLSLVRADAPHFASLRFAQFLSTVMVQFNIFNEVNERLSLQPGALMDAIMKSSNMMIAIQTYNSLCQVALFLATIARHLRPDSHLRTLDLAYVSRVVTASFTKALANLRISVPFCNMPLVLMLIQAVDILCDVANDQSIVATSAPQFTNYLRCRMPTEVWNSFVGFAFGDYDNLENHIVQLWRLGEFADQNGSNIIPITPTLLLSTDFLRHYESAYLSFWFTTDIVDGYMLCVVHPVAA